MNEQENIPEEDNEEQSQLVTEDSLIDYVFLTLYNNLDKNEMHLEKDILAPTELEFDAKQFEHMRELLLATGYIKASVGFGKNGFVYLNQNGIQLMKVYKSYSAYLAIAANLPNMPHMQQPNLNSAIKEEHKNDESLHYKEDDEAS